MMDYGRFGSGTPAMDASWFLCTQCEGMRCLDDFLVKVFLGLLGPS